MLSQRICARAGTLPIWGGRGWGCDTAPHCVCCSAGVTDDSGILISEQRYLPFGGVRQLGGSFITQTDYGYTGQRDLGDMGLMDYRARFYSSSLGRFIQPDSITPDGPQGLNRYSYVKNNPVNFNDPTGHRPCGDGELVDCDGFSNRLGMSTGGSGDGRKVHSPQPEKEIFEHTQDDVVLGYHIGTSFTYVPEQSSDDFVNSPESTICLNPSPKVRAACAIAAAERFAIANNQNTRDNFWVHFDVNYTENVGITISDLVFINYSGLVFDIRDIKFTSGDQSLSMFGSFGSIRMNTGFGSDYHVPGSPVFDGSGEVTMKITYAISADTGNAAFPGPQPIEPTITISLPSLPSLKYFMETNSALASYPFLPTHP